VLVCGNLFQLGSPGFWFREPEQAFRVLEIVDDWEMKTSGRRSAFLIKDVPIPLPDAALEKHGYRLFEGDAAMELHLSPDWKSFEDYVQALSKKYRQRALKITDAGKGLQVRYLEDTEVHKPGGKLESLYRQVWERQPWKPAYLGREYFLAMHRHLGPDFRIQGFFEGENLLAFASHQFHPGDVLEIHYIGIDYSRNEDRALYFNLLFGAIQAGIAQGKKCIWFGRTSEDAKASAGATPAFPLHYIKIRRGLASAIFKKLQAQARNQKAPDWQKRNPFKTDIPV
jgi:predicted N-acyltransferase